ncbi:DUF2855 family protein [Ramlibacter albus]|uniref:DUF2855 family protein n=1 Tax=Ramlibacter albus TaxID=2079448 RepID=A0A923S139_9BURK|nr:DUF2855 family protein [Ramlibacter albus]MBC5763253.1 DUF2855 family protein [Ramlibacter albus]
MNTTLQVRKSALGETRLVQADDKPLAQGEVRMRIDSFSLTANNITYAAFGDAMNYWQFFPTGEEGWGIVPVWGFGTVVQSLHPGVAVGERVYGYWPMARSVVLAPAKLDAHGFLDGAEHRKELHKVYNHYQRTGADPFYTPDTEDVQALLRPLFATSWLLEDFLADNAFFEADTVLVSSASSKTAYGMANQLKKWPQVRVVGFTSARNRAFCESLGCYDQVLAYEEIDRVPEEASCVYTDFAGNADFRRKVHTRFKNLRYSCSIGGTHVQQLGGAKDLPGPRATLFFAPAQRTKRVAEVGAPELLRRLAADWHAFRNEVTNAAKPWLKVRRHEGTDAVVAAYRQVLAGGDDPRTGHVLTLN